MIVLFVVDNRQNMNNRPPFIQQDICVCQQKSTLTPHVISTGGWVEPKGYSNIAYPQSNEFYSVPMETRFYEFMHIQRLLVTSTKLENMCTDETILFLLVTRYQWGWEGGQGVGGRGVGWQGGDVHWYTRWPEILAGN